jgi:hypothetical protein
MENSEGKSRGCNYVAAAEISSAGKMKISLICCVSRADSDKSPCGRSDLA